MERAGVRMASSPAQIGNKMLEVMKERNLAWITYIRFILFYT
jgi:hypothetical protein